MKTDPRFTVYACTYIYIYMSRMSRSYASSPPMACSGIDLPLYIYIYIHTHTQSWEWRWFDEECTIFLSFESTAWRFVLKTPLFFFYDFMRIQYITLKKCVHLLYLSTLTLVRRKKKSEMCREHQEVENHWSRPEKSSWACKELIACPQHASYFECHCIPRWEKEFKFIGRLPLGTPHFN
jgi:hypothetical protein